MSVYVVNTYYSPLIDGEVARVSMADDHGSEYFAIVPKPPSGKGWRAKRDAALDLIEEAIDNGDRPGEVTIPENLGASDDGL